MNIEQAEKKIRAVLDLYCDETVKRRGIPPEAIAFVRSVTTSALLSGISVAAALLTREEGSETITPQSLEQMVLRMTENNPQIRQHICV